MRCTVRLGPTINARHRQQLAYQIRGALWTPADLPEAVPPRARWIRVRSLLVGEITVTTERVVNGVALPRDDYHPPTARA
jgi:hypothetical protein